MVVRVRHGRGFALLVAGVTVAGCAADGIGTSSGAPTPGPAASTAEPGPTVTPQQTPEPTPTPSASAPAGWADVVETVSSGVVDIEVLGCDITASGTGFLVGEDLVLTAAHVAEESVSLTVRGGEAVTTARILGMRRDKDLALLELSGPLPGHVFALQDDVPRVGEEVAVLGYPLSGPLSFTRGAVSGHDRSVSYDDIDMHLEGIIQTDASINPGNSGGPALGPDGTSWGVVTGRVSGAEGIGYVVPSPVALSWVERWQREPEPVPHAECGEPLPEPPAPEAVDLPVLSLDTDHELAPSLAQTLVLHGAAINQSRYPAAWAQLSPPMQQRMGSLEEWEAGLLTTVWHEVHVSAVRETGMTDYEVDADLLTMQSAADGPGGLTCSWFPLTYTMVPSGGGWLIDAASLRQEPFACAG